MQGAICGSFEKCDIIFGRCNIQQVEFILSWEAQRLKDPRYNNWLSMFFFKIIFGSFNVRVPLTETKDATCHLAARRSGHSSSSRRGDAWSQLGDECSNTDGRCCLGFFRVFQGMKSSLFVATIMLDVPKGAWNIIWFHVLSQRNLVWSRGQRLPNTIATSNKKSYEKYPSLHAE